MLRNKLRRSARDSSPSAGTHTATYAAGKAMGWVSLAVGLAEVFATRRIQKLVGVETASAAGVIRVLGVREIAHGLDILGHDSPATGVWGRVAGDVLDGAVLAVAYSKAMNPRGVGLAAAAVAPIVIADLVLAPRLG